MAAVLACGSGAVLSHAAADALWDLRASEATIIDVTVPGSGGRRRRKGLRLHRARSLDGRTTIKDGIPVTTPARTILDLAARLDRRALERATTRAARPSTTTAAATPPMPPPATAPSASRIARSRTAFRCGAVRRQVVGQPERREH